MSTGIILALVTLATAVIGTIFNPKPSIKLLIIGLAFAAATAAIVKTVDDDRDSAFVKRALAAQLATSTPPRDFLRAFDASLERVAAKHGFQYDASFVTMDNERVYWFTRNPGQNREGAMYFDTEDMGNAFVEFVSNKSLDVGLEAAMFTDRPHLELQAGEATADTEAMLYQMAIMARTALKEDEEWSVQDPEITMTTNGRALSVKVEASDGVHAKSVELPKTTVEQLAVMEPIQRNWQAYVQCKKQVPSRS